MMNPVELIRKKRNGDVLTRAELEAFIGGYLKGDIPDYQMSAFLMAVCFTGMSSKETSVFTDVMLRSGKVIDLSALPGKKVDKHSTGGVGDKVSLILAPMVAACGVPVPMISGRGLGHTGGTLDKLESIPGFRTRLSIDEYQTVIAEVGVVLAGQTEDLAPADRRMYALRDVTATIESVPLIAGSIMSKKLAEGIDALVLDVKVGSGAFMEKESDAVALASTLVEIGTAKGKETIAFVTDMGQPLGMMVGNWLEVVESVDCLRGKNVPDLMEVTSVLGGAMVYLGGKAATIEEGMRLCLSAIWSGKAYEKFVQIVERQGGDAMFIRQPQKYPVSEHIVNVASSAEGHVDGFDSRRIGELAVDLGAGRRKVDDHIDPKAGIVLLKKLGDRVAKGEGLAVIHTDRKNRLDAAERELQSAIHIGDQPPRRTSCIRALVDKNGVHTWTTPIVY